MVVALVATLTEADIESAMARAVATLRERSRRPQELMELPGTVETALASLTDDGVQGRSPITFVIGGCHFGIATTTADLTDVHQ